MPASKAGPDFRAFRSPFNLQGLWPFQGLCRACAGPVQGLRRVRRACAQPVPVLGKCKLKGSSYVIYLIKSDSRCKLIIEELRAEYTCMHVSTSF